MRTRRLIRLFAAYDDTMPPFSIGFTQAPRCAVFINITICRWRFEALPSLFHLYFDAVTRYAAIGFIIFEDTLSRVSLLEHGYHWLCGDYFSPRRCHIFTADVQDMPIRLP